MPIKWHDSIAHKHDFFAFLLKLLHYAFLVIWVRTICHQRTWDVQMLSNFHSSMLIVSCDHGNLQMHDITQEANNSDRLSFRQMVFFERDE